MKEWESTEEGVGKSRYGQSLPTASGQVFSYLNGL